MAIRVSDVSLPASPFSAKVELRAPRHTASYRRSSTPNTSLFLLATCSSYFWQRYIHDILIDNGAFAIGADSGVEITVDEAAEGMAV
jgi:hypothetical protein